ncbi:YciI family protein [Microbacterium sp.]|uniref:YciI family protein n=1 Tax=Microbacterium sp. TaxID=51671 RepID=UPI003C775959
MMMRPNPANTQLYLLLLRSTESRWHELPDEDGDAETSAHADLITALQQDGRLVYCSPLAHPAEGALVHFRDGQVQVQPESIDADPIAGFYIVRCASRDEAVALAAQIPDAAYAPVLVRALMDVPAVDGTMTETPQGA